MTLRQTLCDALDHVADLSALADQDRPDTRIVRVTVLETQRATLRRLYREVMAESTADEELCRADEEWPYLRRWWLRRAAASEPSSRAVYLHETIEPDVHPPHNHPWPSASLLVSGRLTDRQFQSRSGVDHMTIWQLSPGDIIYRPARHCHLLDPHGTRALTLFVTGERTQPWGFLRPDNTFGRDRGEHALRGRRAHLEHPQTT